MTRFTKILSGPAAFTLFLVLPIDLSYEGRVALATFAWAVTWWVAQPVPWAVAALLPMLVFPVAGVMGIRPTIGLYGQPIFFWIMGTVLMGYALEKHGLARRAAGWFLARRSLASRPHRLIFAHMTATGLISTCVSDAATVAMMMPMGLSLVSHLQQASGLEPRKGTSLGAFMTLGTFYGAIAGGTGTILGLPHNAIALSLSEDLAGRPITFLSWMSVGLPMFVALIVAFYVVLRVAIRIEVETLPRDAALPQSGTSRTPLSQAEWSVLAVFALMVAAFAAPSVAGLLLGHAHPVAETLDRVLDVWIIPPFVLFLLFLVPSGRKGESLLAWPDAVRQIPWDAMLLCAGAVGMVDALTKFGFVDFVAGHVAGSGLDRAPLLYAAALIVAWSTDFMSGTAAMTLFGSVFIPAAEAVGHNPASMAMMIANVALGLTFPWAGAAAATAFSVGDIAMRRMMAVGIPATIVFALVAATLHLLLGSLV